VSDTGGTGPLSRRPFLIVANCSPIGGLPAIITLSKSPLQYQSPAALIRRLGYQNSEILATRTLSPTRHLITFVLVKPNPKTPNIPTRSCCAMTVVLRAQRLLPTSDAAVILDGAVVVNGDRIKAVGPWSELRNAIPLDASVEALGDVTLMPGLFDCHVWICGKLAIDRNLLTHLVHSRSIFLSTHCRCAPPPILC
jgi:hypothetical protein